MLGLLDSGGEKTFFLNTPLKIIVLLDLIQWICEEWSNAVSYLAFCSAELHRAPPNSTKLCRATRRFSQLIQTPQCSTELRWALPSSGEYRQALRNFASLCRALPRFTELRHALSNWRFGTENSTTHALLPCPGCVRYVSQFFFQS